jgi:hypothetical protein
MSPVFRTALSVLWLCSTALARVEDLRGNPSDPLSNGGKVHVLLFVRTDCPITNRYAPELRRVADRFSGFAVEFVVVYSGKLETRSAVENHMRQYRLPGTALFDRQLELAKRAHATVAPEAAVFDGRGTLLYHGRIDDRWISFGRSRPQPTVHDLENALSAAVAGKVPGTQATEAVGCSLGDAP